MTATTLDLIDRKIVSALMHDATQPIGRIADQVGLSQTPCWKRIQKLEQAGIILKRVALVAPEKIVTSECSFDSDLMTVWWLPMIWSATRPTRQGATSPPERRRAEGSSGTTPFARGRGAASHPVAV